MSAQPVGVLAVMDRTLNFCADIAEFREARAAMAELIEGYKCALDALADIANTTARSLVIGAETYSTSGHAQCVRIASAAIDDEKVSAILARVGGA